MSKLLTVASAFALAAVIGVSGAQAGSPHSSSSGLLGLNLNVGNLLGAKVSVGGSTNTGHSSSGDSLLGLDVKVADVATVKATVAPTNPHQDLVNANVSVGSSHQLSDPSAFGGHDGGVGGW